MSVRIRLRMARAAFPKLFKAEAINAGDVEKFSGAFLISPDHPQVDEINAAMLAVATEKWKDKAEAVLKAIRKNPNRCCFRDGDDKAQLAGYEGNLYVQASSAKRPTVVNKDKSPLQESDGVIYSGCYVNVVFDLFAYTNNGNGIGAALVGVQFAKDGESFGGGRGLDDDDFDVLPDAEDGMF